MRIRAHAEEKIANLHQLVWQGKLRKLQPLGDFALAFEANNTMEKMGVPGLYTGLSAMFPNSSQRAPASRFASRSIMGGMMGPTFELATDASSMGIDSIDSIARAKGTPYTDADVSTARRLMPFASLPYWRWAIDNFVVPSMKSNPTK